MVDLEKLASRRIGSTACHGCRVNYVESVCSPTTEMELLSTLSSSAVVSCRVVSCLVEESFTVHTTAQARDPVITTNLPLEFVIVRQLFIY